MSKRSTTLFCFSPPVMLATLLIEVFFAFYVVWRYNMTTITRLVVSLLGCLAIFQGAEYMLCGGLGLNGGEWSQIGYAAISLLPPLGLHLAYQIAGKTSRWLVPLSYMTAGIFIAYFAFGTQAISGHTCYANYVTFDTSRASSWLYALYYYGWLVTGAFLAWKWSRELTKRPRSALTALTFGYIAFMVPTTAMNIADPSTIAGIPSIMCGFAVILAFVLVARVAPEAITPKHAPHSLRLRLPF